MTWSIFKTASATGEPTAVEVLDRRLASRRGGLAESLAERRTLQEKDAALMARIAQVDASLDVAEPHERPRLEAELAQLREQHAPLASRLAELQASIPARETLIREDERELEDLIFTEKLRLRATWLAEVDQEQDAVMADLQRLCASLRTLAAKHRLLEASQRELLAEARQLGRTIGPWWSTPATVAECRGALTAAYNDGLNTKLSWLHPPKELPTPAAMVDDLRVDLDELNWTSSAEGHCWECGPLPQDHAEGPCTYRENCSGEAVAALTYTPKGSPPRSWVACEQHRQEFAARYRRRQAQGAAEPGARR